MNVLRKLAVLGLGFVGLSTAVFFASKGYDVLASDIEKSKMNKIGRGRTPFFEKNLEPKLKKVLQNQKLKLILETEKAVLGSDIAFVAVGTPSLPSGNPDLSFIKNVSEEIGRALRKKSSYSLVVIKSTVPPGTTETTVRTTIEKYSGKRASEQFGLATSPEFLREGTALDDVAHPHRIVIGGLDKKAGDILEKFNKEIYGEKTRILRMNVASAEFSKYASNAFLATKISFINEMASICEKISGVDVAEIAVAMGLDPRIGPQFLSAGAGWGGSCLPKDTRGMVALSRKFGHEARLTKEVVDVNRLQAEHMVELAEEELKDLRGRRMAVLGLSFKPDTDDIRDAPSLRIIEMLISKGSKVIVYDPMATNNVKRLLGRKIAYAKDVAGCLENADCCMVITEWKEFKDLTPAFFVRRMRNPVLIDCRRIYDPKQFSKALVFRAVGLGRA